MTRLKRVDRGFPPITQLSDMQDLTPATVTRPSNLNETSGLRQILHGLCLKYSLSRTSISSLDKRLRNARSKGLQYLPMRSKYYDIQLVEALCSLARAALRSHGQPQVAQKPPATQLADAEGDPPPNNKVKRKLSSANLPAGVDNCPRQSKRQMTAISSQETLVTQESENEIMVEEEASITPNGTQTIAEGAHISATIQGTLEIANPGGMVSCTTERAVATKANPYTSKEDSETDDTLRSSKPVLAKPCKDTQSEQTGHDTVKEAQAECPLGTKSVAADTCGADAGASSDVEEDDKAGDGSEAQAGTDVSTWHTSTTYRDHRDDRLTLEQITKADALAKSCPLELWRVSAATGSNHTQGWISQQHIKPPAAVEGLKSGAPIYKELYDLPSLSAISRNLAGRLLYTQGNADQFTSYTTSLVFALVLAQRREALGQGGISITRVATRKITTPSGERAKFYFVPELLDILGVVEWKGLSDRARRTLMGTRFHHEYVALGELDLTNNPYRPVMFDQLKTHGLYEFCPDLHIEGNEVEEKKLYHRRLQLSHQWYGPETTTNYVAQHFTEQHLDHAAQLARLFSPATRDTHVDANDNTPRAPLSIFLDFIGLSRRRKRTGSSLGMEHIPNNSPDRLQVMDRIWEACLAVCTAPPPATVPVPVDPLFDRDGVWHGNLKNITGVIAPWTKATKNSEAGCNAKATQAANRNISTWAEASRSGAAPGLVAFGSMEPEAGQTISQKHASVRHTAADYPETSMAAAASQPNVLTNNSAASTALSLAKNPSGTASMKARFRAAKNAKKLTNKKANVHAVPQRWDAVMRTKGRYINGAWLMGAC
ncbi:hypothetical protein LTR17_009280 [Elasticomyces elasticus]|nr:hypothetical protein LTR17_009280 [Elasticomyces elasticus]